MVQQDRFELPMFTLWDQIYSLVLDHHPSSCCIICLIYTCNRTICYMQILETMKQDVIDSMVGHIGAAPIPSCSQNRCASNPHSCPILTNPLKSITWDARTDLNCDFAYIRCSLGYKPSVLTIERRAHILSLITSNIKILHIFFHKPFNRRMGYIF